MVLYEHLRILAYENIRSYVRKKCDNADRG
jgi:hypothetical protein